MFSLVIKEKDGIVGGWLEVGGETYEVPFEDNMEAAVEVLTEWSDWMDRKIDTVCALVNPQGDGWNFKPINVESIALIYTTRY